MQLNKEQMVDKQKAENTERVNRLVALNSQKRSCQPVKDGKQGVEVPSFWKKKNFKPSFWNELVKSAANASIAKDAYGEYRKGTFLYGCALVKVNVHDNGLWSVNIHSEHPIGLPMIKEIRDKYIPDSFLMAMLFQDRAERFGDCDVILYQLPDFTKTEAKK